MDPRPPDDPGQPRPDARPDTGPDIDPAGPDTATDTAPTRADTRPDTADTQPVRTLPVREYDRLPAWWKPKRPLGEEAAPDTEDGGAATKKDCEHPSPHPVHAQRTGELVAYWCADCDTQLPAPESDDADDADGGGAATKETCEHPNPHAVHAQPTGELVAYWCADCDTQLDVPEPADADDDGEAPAKSRGLWRSRAPGARIYRRPAYFDTKPSPKQSLIQWVHQLDAPTRWLLYNGSALAVGFYVGVPQFFKAETAYLAHTYSSWTDWHVCIWYGVAAGVWLIDHRTRGWFPPFALAARIPLVSMIVGTLLHGSSTLTV